MGAHFTQLQPLKVKRLQMTSLANLSVRGVCRYGSAKRGKKDGGWMHRVQMHVIVRKEALLECLFMVRDRKRLGQAHHMRTERGLTCHIHSPFGREGIGGLVGCLLPVIARSVGRSIGRGLGEETNEILKTTIHDSIWSWRICLSAFPVSRFLGNSEKLPPYR